MQLFVCKIMFLKILISIVERKKNENYVEYDFSMGTVLVIFSFY